MSRSAPSRSGVCFSLAGLTFFLLIIVGCPSPHRTDSVMDGGGKKTIAIDIDRHPEDRTNGLRRDGPDRDQRRASRRNGHRSYSISSTGDAGRREGIAHAEGYWEVPVFFGTDREPGIANEDWFGIDRGNDLTYGRCIVTLPDDREPGELPRPHGWWIFEEEEDPLEHVTLESVKRLSESEFKHRLQSRVNQVSRKDVLLFVHGYKTTFNDAAYRTAQLAFDLEFYSPVVMFSWPSDGTLDAYVKDLSTVEVSESTFRRFLGDLRESTQGASIHVIAHSMGNRLATLVLKEIGNESAGQEKLVKSFLLAAPDMGVEELRDRCDGVRKAAESVTIYASANDRALQVSEGVHAGAVRIGMPGDHLLEFCSHGEIEVIDATDANSGTYLLLHHSYVGNNRCVLDDVKSALLGVSVANRQLTPRGFMLAMNQCVR